MKLTRRQLRMIINESINEQNFMDKVKKKLKDKVKSGADNLKDKLGRQEQEQEESREEFVKRVLSEYEYQLGASGKLLAKKTAQGVKLDKTFKIVGSLPGNFNIYVRQPNGSDFVVLSWRTRTDTLVGFGRGLGKDPDDVALIKEFIIKKFIELGGKPAASVDQTADQDNPGNQNEPSDLVVGELQHPNDNFRSKETDTDLRMLNKGLNKVGIGVKRRKYSDNIEEGLSRGSLYRKRYHGRY